MDAISHKLSTDVNLIPIISIWKAHLYDGENCSAPYEPDLTVFELSEEVQNRLEPLRRCHDSSTFQKLWQKYGSIANHTKQLEHRDEIGVVLTVQEIVGQVWEPAKNTWNTLCTELRNGCITFDKLGDFVQSFKDK